MKNFIIAKMNVEKKPKTRNPWLLESVENGIKATNVRETTDAVRENKRVPIQYFEYDRLFGKGAFDSPLKVLELFGELQGITPRTVGYIFGRHKYLYHANGILRVNHTNGKESYYSDDTLRNESVPVYFDLIESTEESRITELIKELDAATSGNGTEDQSQRRIPNQDTEQPDL
jgi:hypothetical protein